MPLKRQDLNNFLSNVMFFILSIVNGLVIKKL